MLTGRALGLIDLIMTTNDIRRFFKKPADFEMTPLIKHPDDQPDRVTEFQRWDRLVRLCNAQEEAKATANDAFYACLGPIPLLIADPDEEGPNFVVDPKESFKVFKPCGRYDRAFEIFLEENPEHEDQKFDDLKKIVEAYIKTHPFKATTRLTTGETTPNSNDRRTIIGAFHRNNGNGPDTTICIPIETTAKSAAADAGS